MASADLGVYVHFPWCRVRCPYCDFAVAVAPLDQIPHDAYADAILAELDRRVPDHTGSRLRSIYFGGGTPGLWRPDALGRVIAAVRARLGDPEEITVEINPNDAPALDALRAAGVNRLSIGTQSFRDDDLVFLGRDHSAAASLSAARAARAAGFPVVSLDLIYALPGRTLCDWQRTLDAAIALAPEHLSVYQLTIEERTPFGAAARKGQLVPADDDTSADQFEAAHARLGEAGYEHYEVSSYARPGFRAVHNSLYWRGADYLGLGVGAHSFRLTAEGAVRRENPRAVSRYLAGDPPRETRHDAAAVRSDEVWLALRTRDGLPEGRLAPSPGLDRLLAAGLLERAEGRIRPTPRGLLFADEIGAVLLE
jgi:oxygen-independent coproporphyrinogen III oxidase